MLPEWKGLGARTKFIWTPLFSQADGITRNRACQRLEIPVTENIYGGMTEAELSEAKEKEFQLAQRDKLVEQAKNQKNALESFVYETRNKVEP